MLTAELICKEFLRIYALDFNKKGKEIPEGYKVNPNDLIQKAVNIPLREIDLKTDTLSDFAIRYIKPIVARLARDTPKNAMYIRLEPFRSLVARSHTDTLFNITARASIGIPDEIDEVPDPIILRFDILYQS